MREKPRLQENLSRAPRYLRIILQYIAICRVLEPVFSRSPAERGHPAVGEGGQLARVAPAHHCKTNGWF